MEAGSKSTFTGVVLKELERSPRLAEIKAVYKSRTKVEARRKIVGLSISPNIFGKSGIKTLWS
jgi:hypothetical protein